MLLQSFYHIEEESFTMIREWLDKCHKLLHRIFNANQKIEGLNGAANGYFPIHFQA
jgi:hypothetical protein